MIGCVAGRAGSMQGQWADGAGVTAAGLGTSEAFSQAQGTGLLCTGESKQLAAIGGCRQWAEGMEVVGAVVDEAV